MKISKNFAILFVVKNIVKFFVYVALLCSRSIILKWQCAFHRDRETMSWVEACQFGFTKCRQNITVLRSRPFMTIGKSFFFPVSQTQVVFQSKEKGKIYFSN